MTAAEVVALAVCETQTQGTGYAAAFMPEGTAAIRALEAAGFRVVPARATPEMLGAFWRIKSGYHCHDEAAPTDTSDGAAYAAMLAAAGGPRDE